MRILGITNLYPNPYQPLRATFNRQLFRALGEQSPLQLISPIAWTDELISQGKGDLPRDRRVTLDGLTIEHPRYFYTPKVFRHWHGTFYRLSVRKAFARAVAEFHPDIVFAPWVYPDGWAAVELGHAAGLPVVVKVHGSDIRVLSRYRGRRRRTVQALNRADGVVAVSRELAGQVTDLSAGPATVCVMYSGVDSRLFRPGSREEARIRLGLPEHGLMLLFVGNLVPVKGVDVLVKSCAQLMKGGAQVSCYVIGQGPSRSELERLIARLELRDRVQLIGAMTHDQLPDWFRAANVFVLPSRSEGLPTVLLEALACGTPFVASRVGGIPELAHLGMCKLVRPDDPTTLADAIRYVIAEGEGSTGVASMRPPLRTYDEEAKELVAFLATVQRAYHESGSTSGHRLLAGSASDR